MEGSGTPGALPGHRPRPAIPPEIPPEAPVLLAWKAFYTAPLSSSGLLRLLGVRPSGQGVRWGNSCWPQQVIIETALSGPKATGTGVDLWVQLPPRARPLISLSLNVPILDDGGRITEFRRSVTMRIKWAEGCLTLSQGPSGGGRAPGGGFSDKEGIEKGQSLL